MTPVIDGIRCPHGQERCEICKQHNQVDTIHQETDKEMEHATQTVQVFTQVNP